MNGPTEHYGLEHPCPSLFGKCVELFAGDVCPGCNRAFEEIQRMALAEATMRPPSRVEVVCPRCYYGYGEHVRGGVGHREPRERALELSRDRMARDLALDPFASKGGRQW